MECFEFGLFRSSPDEVSGQSLIASLRMEPQRQAKLMRACLSWWGLVGHPNPRMVRPLARPDAQLNYSLKPRLRGRASPNQAV